MSKVDIGCGRSKVDHGCAGTQGGPRVWGPGWAKGVGSRVGQGCFRGKMDKESGGVQGGESSF